MQIILINILIYKIDNIRKHNVFWPHFIFGYVHSVFDCVKRWVESGNCASGVYL